jgi:hypothetical protein
VGTDLRSDISNDEDDDDDDIDSSCSKALHTIPDAYELVFSKLSPRIILLFIEMVELDILVVVIADDTILPLSHKNSISLGL